MCVCVHPCSMCAKLEKTMTKHEIGLSIFVGLSPFLSVSFHLGVSFSYITVSHWKIWFCWSDVVDMARRGVAEEREKFIIFQRIRCCVLFFYMLRRFYWPKKQFPFSISIFRKRKDEVGWNMFALIGAPSLASPSLLLLIAKNSSVAARATERDEWSSKSFSQ